MQQFAGLIAESNEYRIRQCRPMTMYCKSNYCNEETKVDSVQSLFGPTLKWFENEKVNFWRILKLFG